MIWNIGYSKFFRPFIIFYYSAFLAFSISTHLLSSGPEKPRKKAKIVSVWVAKSEVKLYAKPDFSEVSTWSAKWIQVLPVDQGKVEKSPQGWLPILGTKENAARGKGPMPDMWIRREDVVLKEDFKKVVNCWPVQSVSFEAGEYSAIVTFQLDGSALVEERGGDSSILGSQPERAHVYMAQGIVEIRGPSFYFNAGYCPKERRLYPEGMPASAQELFPERMLRDCATIPTLE